MNIPSFSTATRFLLEGPAKVSFVARSCVEKIMPTNLRMASEELFTAQKAASSTVFYDYLTNGSCYLLGDAINRGDVTQALIYAACGMASWGLGQISRVREAGKKIDSLVAESLAPVYAEEKRKSIFGSVGAESANSVARSYSFSRDTARFCATCDAYANILAIGCAVASPFPFPLADFLAIVPIIVPIISTSMRDSASMSSFEAAVAAQKALSQKDVRLG